MNTYYENQVTKLRIAAAIVIQEWVNLPYNLEKNDMEKAIQELRQIVEVPFEVPNEY